ncbi:MAG: hypothetical protein NC936_05665 [Candidatus Omnitrophica bacterium]|nr:hypothetical protein [Candidatus Omnitrophota bacterium]
MILHCTAKLLKEMNIAKPDAADIPPQSSLLGDWYANLFFLSRKKNLIFTNARTLFTFIAFGVNRAQMRNITELFRRELGKALLDEDFDGETIQRIINDCKEVHIAKATDRSVLGVMVDHVKNVRWMVEERDGGWNSSNLSEVIKQLNRTPLLSKEFTYSIEELGKVLGIKIDPKLNFKPKFSIISQDT